MFRQTGGGLLPADIVADLSFPSDLPIFVVTACWWVNFRMEVFY